MQKAIVIAGISILNFIGALVFLQGCSPDDCGPFKTNFTPTVVESSVMRIAGESGQTPGHFTFDFIGNNTVPYDSLAIILNFEGNFSQRIKGNFGFNMTFACSPPPPIFSVSEILITSDSEFNMQHPAGSDLSDLFEIRLGSGIDGVNVREFIDENQEWYGFEDHVLNIVSPPGGDSDHAFTIVLTLDSGDKISVILEEVSLTN